MATVEHWTVWRDRIQEHAAKLRVASERVCGIIDELRDRGVRVKHVRVDVPFGHGVGPTGLDFAVEHSD